MTKAVSLPQKKLNDKYILGDEIGKGAYGRVYKGLDMDNGDFVAIKQVSLENIPQEDLNIIMQEIDLLKNLNHKNIVKYMGSFKTKTHLYIILEYVENGSLASIVKPNKFGAFPESLVAVYITQVLEGLVYLHEQGVIHRDIKGANILTTKEGLVKLADFGVATKLTEADVNTHSVVGTPYWMAPEVIEMSGVSAASDIWSVGCTVIELLTCEPPYFDLQPMPALFRIVQDEHPPIPEHLSAGLTDFLHQCFQKDAKSRPDAKTLLMHPWIQNSRKDLQSSLQRTGGRIRNVPQHVSTVVERTIEDGKMEDKEIIASEQNTDNGQLEVEMESHHSVPQNHSKVITNNLLHSSKQPSNVRSTDEGTMLEEEYSSRGQTNADINRKIEPDKASVSNSGVRLLVSVNGTDGSRTGHDTSNSQSPKAASFSTISTVQRLSRFGDNANDEVLDELFSDSPQRHQRSLSQEASTSNIASQANQQFSSTVELDNSELTTKLRAEMPQKQTCSRTGKRNGNSLLSFMLNVADDVAGLDGIVIEEKVSSKDIYPKQAIEVSRLFSMLKREESEDNVLSACKKLFAIFHDFPDQKMSFISQHGLVPIMDMLEGANSRVILSVLQFMNLLINENAKCLENACHIGLIPVVMNLASPDHSKDIRMQTAYFVQQLCQTSASTLQMFIACRGLPVLVGFLEPDYSKYREMVHIAIDCMWNVFNLKTFTPRNDFCRISAKNGILNRLVNTLHSLNEAVRLASFMTKGAAISGSDCLMHQAHSSSHDLISSESNDTQLRQVQNDITTSRTNFSEQTFPIGTSEPSQTSVLHSRRSDINEHGKGFLSSNLLATSVASNMLEFAEGSLPSRTQESQVQSSADHEQLNSGLHESSQIEETLSRQRSIPSVQRGATEQSWRRTSLSRFSNGGHSSSQISFSQNEPAQPLLSLLEKEPPSRHVSGQLEYIRHLNGGLEHHQSITPVPQSSAERTNPDLDASITPFSDSVDNIVVDATSKLSPKCNKRNGVTIAPSGVATSEGVTSDYALRTASGVLSGSGVLNARPGSTTSSGILSQMVPFLNADIANTYLEKVADLLLAFSQADTTVKAYMCSLSLLIRLFQMLNKLDSPILLKILKCINQLSTDPNCLEYLQRADAIKHLVPNLEERDGPLVPEIHIEALNALYNLCKINKRRQEQAAENGIIPHLMRIIISNSPLKPTALPLLCDMAHASRYTREQLRVYNGLDVYLSLLDDEIWSVTALDSIAVCLAHDNDHRKVEQALLRKEAIQKLVTFFRCCKQQYFVHILEPFLKIVTKSVRINTTLAVNGLTPLLVARLDHQDAIARLNLLKLIKVVYEHHPRPKELIIENDLPLKLQNLIEERGCQRSGGQVLVKQMATALLKALHINTVL